MHSVKVKIMLASFYGDLSAVLTTHYRVVTLFPQTCPIEATTGTTIFFLFNQTAASPCTPSGCGDGSLLGVYKVYSGKACLPMLWSFFCHLYLVFMIEFSTPREHPLGTMWRGMVSAISPSRIKNSMVGALKNWSEFPETQFLVGREYAWWLVSEKLNSSAFSFTSCMVLGKLYDCINISLFVKWEK